MVCFTPRDWLLAGLALLLLVGCRSKQAEVKPADQPAGVIPGTAETDELQQPGADPQAAAAVVIPPPSRQVTAKVLKEAIDRSGQYLVENCGQSGRFTYLAHP
ncbi:MAG: hypothetical protein VB817_13700, partial [Pirellulaceae bacterium]